MNITTVIVINTHALTEAPIKPEDTVDKQLFGGCSETEMIIEINYICR